MRSRYHSFEKEGRRSKDKLHDEKNRSIEDGKKIYSSRKRPEPREREEDEGGIWNTKNSWNKRQKMDVIEENERDHRRQYYGYYHSHHDQQRQEQRDPSRADYFTRAEVVDRFRHAYKDKNVGRLHSLLDDPRLREDYITEEILDMAIYGDVQVLEKMCKKRVQWSDSSILKAIDISIRKWLPKVFKCLFSKFNVRLDLCTEHIDPVLSAVEQMRAGILEDMASHSRRLDVTFRCSRAFWRAVELEDEKMVKFFFKWSDGGSKIVYRPEVVEPILSILLKCSSPVLKLLLDSNIPMIHRRILDLAYDNASTITLGRVASHPKVSMVEDGGELIPLFYRCLQNRDFKALQELCRAYLERETQSHPSKSHGVKYGDGSHSRRREEEEPNPTTIVVTKDRKDIDMDEPPYSLASTTPTPSKKDEEVDIDYE